MDQRRRALLGSEDFHRIEEQSLLSNHSDVDDFGSERSGAGWQRPANFCITSAFVRILGAMEQHEIDVLKLLFYFRPSGPLGPAEEQEIISPSKKQLLDIVQEVPQKVGDKEVFEHPPIWTWIKKYAENNVERKKILKDVFGITPTPSGLSKEEAKKYNKQRLDLYEKRNKIAHGRSLVFVTLAEYVDAETHIYRSMLHINQECITKLKLSV